MAEEELIQHLKDMLPDYLLTEHSVTDIRRNFSCIVCHTSDKNPSMAYYEKKKIVRCFHCGENYDIFDLIGVDYGLRDFTDRLIKAKELYGDTFYRTTCKRTNERTDNKLEQQQDIKFMPSIENYREWNATAPETDYFSKRGISIETVNKFMLGYLPKWKHPSPNSAKAPFTERIIIPTSSNSYVARAVSDTVEEKYRKMKVGSSELFHSKALLGAEAVFIVEGEFDALSVAEVGKQATALGSVANKRKFLDFCAKNKPTAPLILSLDNDEIGKKTQIEIKAELEKMGMVVYEANVSGECKDPNEYLVKDRESFIKAVNSIDIQEVQNEADGEKQKYLQTASFYSIDDFRNHIAISQPPISTGFTNLDSILDGGLFEGLYFLGAISSLGKTTFLLQIADQIAKRGTDVLVFSLEMSKYELMAKSISRLTFELCEDTKNAKTSRNITDGSKYSQFNNMERGLINNAFKAYEEYSGNVYIHAGFGNIGTEQIKETIKKHITYTRNNPVVIIDYLQVIAPFDMRSTDKQNTDRAVVDLKLASIEYHIPILSISSFNRDNYLAPVNMSSFKESGAIEYSSDILLGLQFQGMEELSQSDTKRAESLKKLESWKQANPRLVELKVLKNRNGKIGSVGFEFYPLFNAYKESIFNKELPKNRVR